MNGQPPQMLPAYEQLKVYVVSNLFDMTENYAEIQKMFYLKKFPRAIVASFKAQILKFYRFLHPHMLEYQGKLTVEAEVETYKKVMEYMNYYKDNPRLLTLEEALSAFEFMMQFCQDSGLTKLTVQRV